jgi:hypothetical protein
MWIVTMIQSRGAHESGEQWKHDGHEVFRQIQSSVRIITLHSVFLCIMIHWGEIPSTPPFICLRDMVYKEYPSRL